MQTATVDLGTAFFGSSVGESDFSLGQIDPGKFIFDLIRGGIDLAEAERRLKAAEEAAEAQEAAARAVVEAARIQQETELARIAAQEAAQERALSADLIPGVPNIVLGVTGAGLLTLGALRFFGVI